MKEGSIYRLATILLIVSAFSVNDGNVNACTTIIVGKDASSSGSVLLAHNEDDDLPQIVVHSKVPQKSFASDALVTLDSGAVIDQVETTAEYIWLDLPGEPYSESGLNQWGVCVTSNNCPSRQDLADLTQGGIGPMLRQIIIERAETAREGVQLIGELVEKFGYQASGRTYFVCDAEEAWLICLVRGKHWLAWRVPNGQVCVVANSFVVREIDFSDVDHIMASPDLVEYAVSQGWFDPEEDGDFDFALAYADPRMHSHPTNFGRQWSGLGYFSAHPLKFGNDLPASITPIRKVGISDLIEALRDHYEGTVHFHPDTRTGDPHFGTPGTICSPVTVSSFVVEYRKSSHSEIRSVYWACLGRPCTSCFIPFYFGIPGFPEGWEVGSKGRPGNEDWLEWTNPPFKADSLNSFATAINFRTRVCENYRELNKKTIEKFTIIESEARDMQTEFESRVSGMLKIDRITTANLLLEFSEGFYHKSLMEMDDIID